MNIEEWYQKADYEGGLVDGFAYGLKPSDIDDPTGEWTEAVGFLEQAYSHYQAMEMFLRKAEDVGPEVEEY